jgi:hypothetical protein
MIRIVGVFTWRGNFLEYSGFCFLCLRESAAYEYNFSDYTLQ